jgi:aryl-alcohol dehydrogenase-like predicted oxidoreductase
MRTRPLGNTGLTVTELALGTWGISGEGYGSVPEGEEERVLGRAFAVGIRLFETAAHYGHGATERRLGATLRGATDAIVVTRLGTDRSKVPAQKNFAKEALAQELTASLERLEAAAGPKVVALLHNPSVRALDSGALDALREAHESGSLASYGVSVGSLEVAEKALEIGAPVLSFPYNIFHVEPLRGLREKLKEKGTGVLAHSVLAYGILSGRHSASKVFPYNDHRSERYPDDTLRARVRHLDAVRPLVSGDVDSLRSAALRFALAEPTISSVVLGPKNGAQLDQLIRDGRAEPPYLSEGKLSGLEARLGHLGVR